jgi:RNA polymerase sigma factor (sigma-70 family)
MNSGSTSLHPDGGADSSPSNTHWSLICAAGNKDSPRHREATETLARRYWRSLREYALRCGHSPEDADDATQEFLAAFLHKGTASRADPDRGRFRTFILACFKNHLRNARDRMQAKRRGGDWTRVGVPGPDETQNGDVHWVDRETPDQAFDRSWAIATLERALAAVRLEYLAAGQGSLHAELRALIWDDDHRESYAQVAARLRMTESAVKMAVLRLRRRCRKALLDEVAQTVSERSQVEDECRRLLAALRR